MSEGDETTRMAVSAGPTQFDHTLYTVQEKLFAIKEIKNQIIFTSNDIKHDAIKIGMLYSSDVVNKIVYSLNIIKVKMNNKKCYNT